MNLYPNPHADHCPWHSYAEKWGPSNIKWCEENICSIVSEPANTWSNLAYIFIFLSMLRVLRKNSSFEMYWLAGSMFFLGAFSFFYHMSNFYVSQLFDFIGMYMFLFWYFCMNLKHLKLVATKNMIMIYLSLVMFFTMITHVSYFMQFKFQLLVVLVGAMICFSELLLYRKQPKNPSSFKFFYIGLALIIFAECFSFADLLRLFCMPSNHFIQGHSIWHVLSAIGLFYTFKHQQLRYAKKR